MWPVKPKIFTIWHVMEPTPWPTDKNSVLNAMTW